MRMSLRGCGQLEFHDRPEDGPGMRTACEFLRGVVAQLCIQATAYYKWRHDNHFLRFNERMMYSQVAVAINSLTKIHVSEENFERFQSKDASMGRADFWAHYKKTNILLELKQHYAALEGGYATKRFSKKLKSLASQTRSLAKTVRGWDQKAALIGLCVVLPYRESNSSERLETIMKKPGMNPQAQQQKFVNAIRAIDDVNFVASWLPPAKMKQYHHDDDSNRDSWEYNPFVGFVAKITSLVR